ncbi:MAG: fumarylacetoacetate hydrolase family protein [Ignavibacteria bacterium]|nr:fumarylacetoacetate hydrolase family protein [Ignavibacteria bacterium]
MNYNEFEFLSGERMPVGTFFCIGKNYSEHIKEMGGTGKEEPVIFIKPPAAYLPNGGTILIPSISINVHHELELVVLIGKDCANVPKENAKEYIAGYAVGIDVTMRDVQGIAKAGGNPWSLSKGFYTSAPVSQFISPSQLPAGHEGFEMELRVNGELRQSGNTSGMIHSIDEIIEYLSAMFTLRRGDAIYTGTPQGVGQIKSGDVVTAELKGFVSLEVKVANK